MKIQRVEVTLKLAVVGSRTFASDRHAAYIFGVLDAVHKAYPQLTHVVSGGARGPDRRAAEWAKERGIKLVEHLADWTVGNHAGRLRNVEVAKDCDAMLAFWDGRSPGTLHAIGCARTLEKPVFVDYMNGNGPRAVESAVSE